MDFFLVVVFGFVAYICVPFFVSCILVSDIHSSDAETVRKVFIEFAIFIMDDARSGSFILCMHKTINNKQGKIL